MLGIRTVELQIAVTVFTIGLLAFRFTYRFLADISTRLYATIACLLLMTDYIMFTQWHVGAWHVWKMFLLFGGLYLAQRVAARKQAYPLLMVYAFHAFLFYYETIFNVYVAAAVFLYFIFVTRDYRFPLKFGLAQFAGALTAAAVLLGQLMLQFGWDVVRMDIYYTFIGRNFATDVASFLEAARTFYANHNIVFWLNVPDSGFYRNLPWAVRFLFQDHAVHTPPWSLVVLAFAAAEIAEVTGSASTLVDVRRRKQARDGPLGVRASHTKYCAVLHLGKTPRDRSGPLTVITGFDRCVMAHCHGHRNNRATRSNLALAARPASEHSPHSEQNFGPPRLEAPNQKRASICADFLRDLKCRHIPLSF